MCFKNNKKAEYNEGGKMNGRLTVVEVLYKCVNLLNCIWRKKRSLPLQMTQLCFEFKWIQSVYACHEGDKNKAVMVWSQQTPGYVVLWLTGEYHRCTLWPHKGLFWEVSVSGLKADWAKQVQCRLLSSLGVYCPVTYSILVSWNTHWLGAFTLLLLPSCHHSLGLFQKYLVIYVENICGYVEKRTFNIRGNK